jgi:hypothetical protein
MRTISDIKKELTDAFMADAQLQAAYGFAPGTAFDKQFSRISLESLLLYIVAFAQWTLEKLFDTHTQEVTDYIATMKPHTLRWYQEKAKAFLYGFNLIDGTDQFDTTGKSDDEIAQAQVVKFAAVTESGATLYLKIAGEESGRPKKLDASQKAAFEAYLHEYKDAGVRVDVTSEQGDYLRLSLDVYYNPLLLTATGQSKSDGTYPVEDAIKSYIEQLPFNGEYRNNALVDAIQQTTGVVMVQLHSAAQSVDNVTYNPVAAFCTPFAGYFEYDRDGAKTIQTINYIPYGTDEN